MISKSGFDDTLTYNTEATVCDNSDKKISFSLNVETNVGKMFLELVKRRLPKETSLYKIFNKSKLKLSYSCMGNVASVLSAHIRNILDSKNIYGLQL